MSAREIRFSCSMRSTRLEQIFEAIRRALSSKSLDPRQNHSFVDHYLDVPFDLSQVIFIATANYMDPVPLALRDRMEVIEIPGYTEREKLEIARRYLVPRQLSENGLKPEQCQWDELALKHVISDYTHEAGVRELERQIGAVCRGVAAEIARGEQQQVAVTPEVVAVLLGPPRYVREQGLKPDTPGVVTGLAYTPTGGEVLYIEAIRYPGKGGITLTGQIGNVMKESAQAALSLLRARAETLGIDAEALKDTDIHVHVPAGAVPKDGPSAGVAMFTALASLFTNRRVRSERRDDRRNYLARVGAPHRRSQRKKPRCDAGGFGYGDHSQTERERSHRCA